MLIKLMLNPYDYQIPFHIQAGIFLLRKSGRGKLVMFRRMMFANTGQ